MSQIIIVDVGLGNVSSVRNLTRRLGYDAELASQPPAEHRDQRYVLPGVGAFDTGIVKLRASGWFNYLVALPAEAHLLGICLGMQLLGNGSAEGDLPGLGRVPMTFSRLPDTERVPHMGWNNVRLTQPDVVMDPDLPEYRYYFTHTYYATCDDPAVTVGETYYGIDFPSVIRRDNTRGVQFHPEKSHKFGMSLMTRWLSAPC